MGSEMTVFQNTDVICLLFAIHGAWSVSAPHKDVKFSATSIMEAALPVIHPIVAAGSDRCETFKSFFGLTYEQMAEKKVTSFYESLNIDHITKYGNVKYNMTLPKRMSRHIRNAKEVVVLIHGYLESSDGVMVQGIAPALLKQPGVTTLALDGRKVISLEYFRSSTYARFMGEQLGNFLHEIIKEGQDPLNITLIGHSLGAHIAGIAGKQLRQISGRSVGRIVGLDPAGPCFSNISKVARLDSEDAEYVDVIHTSAGMLGLLDPDRRISTQLAA
ncbi:hypothetical protein ACJJTC_015303 [Scirpophaga incertulas]